MINTKQIAGQWQIPFFNKTYKLQRLKPAAEPSQDILYMHCLDFENFFQYQSIFNNGLLTGVEIKTENFPHMFHWQGQFLRPAHGKFKWLKNILDSYGLKSQIHFPFYSVAGRELSAAQRADYPHLLHVFEVYSELVSRYGFGRNITVHPPSIADHFNPQEVKTALARANEFYLLLGQKISEQNWPIVVGLENQAEPYINNYKTEALGYRGDHFKTMLQNTNSALQLTLDSGHRQLSKTYQINGLAEWCLANNKYIANFHFHANNGFPENAAENDICYDSHDPALPENLIGYEKYLLRAVYENIPLNLEINFQKYSPVQLFEYIASLQKTIAAIYLQAQTTAL